MKKWTKQINKQAHKAYKNCPEKLSDIKYNMFGDDITENDFNYFKKGDLFFTYLQEGFKRPFSDTNLKNYIGYVVQIRKANHSESEQWFLRHPDGSIIAHENQMFKKTNPDNEKFLRSLFNQKLFDKDMSNTKYSILINGEAKDEREGFIV